MRTRSSGSTTLIGALRRRAAAVPLGLVAAGALIMAGGGVASASSASQPTLAQDQHKLNQLTNELQRLDQQYDQVQQELAAAGQQLALVNTEAARYLRRFDAMRAQVAEIATTAYMDGSLTTPEALLTSSDPQQILNQSSILLELASSNSAEMNAFLAAARQLSSAQASARRVRDGILQLKDKLAAEKKAVNKLVSRQQSLVNQLTPAQQAGTGPGDGVGTVGEHDPLPTTTQAEKAVEFAFEQIGCPYVFGGTGPCPDGFDCSGLTQAAWAFAGVSIPRTSYEQADLPQVPLSEIQPGDILEFLDEGHVGLYVGDNKLIDAPQTGEDVQEVSFTGWYRDNFDFAVAP